MFSDTALSTSRFISPSVTKANRSPILTLILIVNKTHLAVFEIGEYHLGNIIGYIPVLAGGIFSHVRRLDQSRASANI